MNKVKFGELFEYKKKSKIKAGDGLKINEGKYPFYTSSNTLSKSIDEFQFSSASLIFGTGGMPSVHFCEKEFAVSTDCLVAQPKDVSKIYVPYSYYFFTQNNMRVLQEGFKGAGLKHISRNYIDKIKIPLPQLKTQKHIAQILDDAVALRDKTKQLLIEYDLLAQAIFSDMFGDLYLNTYNWPKTIVSDICLEIVDCVNKTAPLSDDETEYKMIRTTNVRDRQLILENLRTVSKETFKKWTRRLVPQTGDIIFTREAPVGEAGILNSNLKLFLGQRTMQYRVNPEMMNNVFFLYQLTSSYLKIQMNKISSGSTVKHLSVPLCKNFVFRDPPIELQNQFAEKIALIEKQKALAKQELQESEDLFNCLLQKAFKGELV